jgi:hypothetical protein
MNTFKIIVALVLYGTFGNIYSQGVISVNKVGETPLKSINNTFIYALPQTNFTIKVSTKRNITFAGPYHAYADEFLGINNIAHENSFKWSIDSIEIETNIDANPEELYAIETNKNFNPNDLAQLTNSGFIINPLLINASANSNNAIQTQKHDSIASFNNLSSQKFYREFTDTLYKTILRDSAYIRIPIIKSRTETKTIHDKAREAADVILKIRQRRIEIVTSDEESLPEANSYKLALVEMTKIEEEYLQLFTGKAIIQSFTSYFNITPSNNNIDKPTQLFYFSEQNGITDKSENGAYPISINFKKDDKMGVLNQWLEKHEGKDNKHLIYTIPDQTTIEILLGNKMFLSKKLSVFQFGSKVPYPSNLGK